MNEQPAQKSALIIVDVLNDFVEGGALAVKDGNAVIPVINRIQDKFDIRVALQEAHRPSHCSFYVNHPGKKMGDVVTVNGLPQVLWPVHGVYNEAGSDFAPGLDVSRVDRVVQKGMHDDTDSYSGFADNGGRNDTGLADYLRSQGVTTVFVSGLATEYCDKATAIDAVNRGFKTYLVEDACRGVDFNPGDVARGIQELKEAGVIVIQSDEIDAVLNA